MKATKHERRYVGSPSGGGKIVCSCGYETPVVDDGTAFTLGRKLKTVEQYFEEHVAAQHKVHNAMLEPAAEQTLAPAQHSEPSSPKRKIERR